MQSTMGGHLWGEEYVFSCNKNRLANLLYRLILVLESSASTNVIYCSVEVCIC